MGTWTPPPDGQIHLTLGERILVDSCWLCLALLWLWMRSRAKRSAKSPPHDGIREKPTHRAGDWLRLRLWISWPRLLGRVMFAAILTTGVVVPVVDVVDVILSIRRGR